jgi:Glycosyltransferase
MAKGVNQKNMKILLQHPTGNANVRAVLKSCYDKKYLYKFIISVALTPGYLYELLVKQLKISDFKRRFFEGIYSSYIISYPAREILRLFFQKLKWNVFIKHETGICSIDQIYISIDRKTARWIQKNHTQIDAVYVYEDAALYSFIEAQKYKIKCIYDLPIGYYKAARELMLDEYTNNKSWAQTITGFNDSQEKLNRKDEELALADHIFVASSFTKFTLEKYYTYSSLPPISVIPYGFPAVNEKKMYDYDENRPLKVLYVGGLSQRKGIANVIEAAIILADEISLTLIGQKSIEDCDALNHATNQFEWIPSLPHNQILEQMRKHDVLVFPSLFEGFGLVITEAMSQGTPVITTDRTIGGDFIVHNQNGWLVPVSDTQAIVAQIKHIITNPALIAANGEAARITAQSRPWMEYEKEMATAIGKL